MEEGGNLLVQEAVFSQAQDDSVGNTTNQPLLENESVGRLTFRWDSSATKDHPWTFPVAPRRLDGRGCKCPLLISDIYKPSIAEVRVA